VLGMSDRVMVMCEGRSTTSLDIREATQENIMALATGTDINKVRSNGSNGQHAPESQPTATSA